MWIRRLMPLGRILPVAALMLVLVTAGQAWAQRSDPPPGTPMPNANPGSGQQGPQGAAGTATSPAVPSPYGQELPPQPLPGAARESQELPPQLLAGSPAGPIVVLYDQYNSAASTGTTSQVFGGTYSSHDDFAADDFVVPPGSSWTVTQVEVGGQYLSGPGPATAVNVFLYTDSSDLPGTPVASQPGIVPSLGPGAGDFVIPLAPVVLYPGTYWISVQAVEDFSSAGLWVWTNRTVTSNNSAAWENPNGGWGIGCTSWGSRTTCADNSDAPDQVFRLSGALHLYEVLYDQYNHAGINAAGSQQFEAAYSSLDDFAADDFVVPPGTSWTVTQVDVDGQYYNGMGPATAVNVFLNSDSSGLPGISVAAQFGIVPFLGPGPGDFVIPLAPVVLPSGTYWISVQAIENLSPAGQWGWTERTETSNNAAAWENPNGGWGTPCTSWGRRGTTCGFNPSQPDQVFRLIGVQPSSDVLYDQYDNAAGGTNSQEFEAAYSNHDDFAADDFVVPSNDTWKVTEVQVDGFYSASGPASAVNVFVYRDSSSLPGTQVASRTGIVPSPGPAAGAFIIPLSPGVLLPPGKFWISVQALQDHSTAGYWYWRDRAVLSNNAAAWQNPGGGFGFCPTWGRRGATCGIDAAAPDQVFRLIGVRLIFLPLILR